MRIIRVKKIFSKPYKEESFQDTINKELFNIQKKGAKILSIEYGQIGAMFVLYEIEDYDLKEFLSFDEKKELEKDKEA